MCATFGREPLGRAFPLGPTASRIGKSGRPHILRFCVLKVVSRYRGVLVMFSAKLVAVDGLARLLH